MRQFILTISLALSLFCGLAGPVFAVQPSNVDAAGVAIEGYDPVAYFTDGKPAKGDEKFQSSYQGATYHFASAEHKALFDKEPIKYAPQFGGFCAYGVSQGHAVAADPTVFVIMDNRLLLQYSGGACEAFNQDKVGNLQKADANWPKLSEPKGK